MQAIFVGAHVALPVFPLVNVGGAELPVLVRLIDARKETLSLLLVRKVQENLDDLRAVAMKMLLQIADGVIPLGPNIPLITQLFGQSLAAQKFRMNANYQHFLVIGTIKDADPASFGKAACGAPEKVMFEFFGTRLLEAEHLTVLRIDSRHDMPDGSIFPGAVHSLEDQEQCMPIGGVVK